MIYFDNAATTVQKPKEVIDAVVHSMNSLGNAGRGGNTASLDASRMLYEARTVLADFFGAGAFGQTVFTSNSTEALNIAIKGILNPGDHVISTHLEHNSVLRPLYEMEQKGVELTLLKSDGKGRLTAGDFEHAIQSNTKAIICTHASNVTGNMLPVEEIGKIVKKHHLIYIVDASQTAGFLPIDMERMNIDILCFTGHKSLMGPQGTGGMIIRKGLSVRPLKSGGSGIETFSRTHPSVMPTALEAGTLNGHGISGLLAAVKFIQNTGQEQIQTHESALMNRFIEGVLPLPHVRLYGDFEESIRCPIVALNIEGYDSAAVSDELDRDFGIVVRSGGHCAPLMHEDFNTVSQGMVRFSFSYYNTESEVDYSIETLKKMIFTI